MIVENKVIDLIGLHAYGGGIFHTGTDQDYPHFTNNTIILNKAKSGGYKVGGGVCCDGTEPLITNTIVFGNIEGTQTVSEIESIYPGDPDVTYCCVKNGYPGTGNTDETPSCHSTLQLHLNKPLPEVH